MLRQFRRRDGTIGEMHCKTGHPLYYMPWQRGFKSPTRAFESHGQSIGEPVPNEGSPLWELPPDIDNPIDEADDDVGYVPTIKKEITPKPPEKVELIKPIIKQVGILID